MPPQEMRVFEAIGRRLSDALSSLLSASRTASDWIRQHIKKKLKPLKQYKPKIRNGATTPGLQTI